MFYTSGRCRNVFKNLPIVACRWSYNLSDILVGAQLLETDNCNNVRATPGSFRCNSRNCTICPILTSAVATLCETYKVKSHITCNTFIVIYIIQCRLCNLQYIGETKHRLKDRSFTPKPPFQNTFSAIATLFPIRYLSQLIYLGTNYRDSGSEQTWRTVIIM